MIIVTVSNCQAIIDKIICGKEMLENEFLGVAFIYHSVTHYHILKLSGVACHLLLCNGLKINSVFCRTDLGFFLNWQFFS